MNSRRKFLQKVTFSAAAIPFLSSFKQQPILLHYKPEPLTNIVKTPHYSTNKTFKNMRLNHHQNIPPKPMQPQKTPNHAILPTTPHQTQKNDTPNRQSQRPIPPQLS